MSDHVTIIPVFNEAATIGGLVERAALHGPVIVVDDGSWDGSDETAAAAGAVILRTGGRLGKGAALRLGFAGALARTAERVVTLDGDGQHDPDDIPRLLAASEPKPDALALGRHERVEHFFEHSAGRAAAEEAPHPGVASGKDPAHGPSSEHVCFETTFGA